MSVGLAVGAALVVIATASWTSAALALARAHPDAPCSVNQFLTRYPGRCLVGFVIGLTGASSLQGEYGVWVYAVAVLVLVAPALVIAAVHNRRARLRAR